MMRKVLHSGFSRLSPSLVAHVQGRGETDGAQLPSDSRAVVIDGHTAEHHQRFRADPPAVLDDQGRVAELHWGYARVAVLAARSNQRAELQLARGCVAIQNGLTRPTP